MFDVVKIAVALCVFVFAVTFIVRNKPSMALRLLFALLFFRFVLAAFHQYTYPPIVSSLSLISMASIGSVALCFILLPLVKPKGQVTMVMSKFLLPIYCFIALMLLSAVVNSELKVGLPSFIKWVYLLQLVTLISYAMTLDGLKKTLHMLLVAYSFPIVMLLLSIVMGVSKKTELDGSISYVGGFFHEAVFSTIVFSASFFAVTYAKKFSKSKAVGVFGILAISFLLMIFVNYRTAIIAFAFMAALLLLSSLKRVQAPLKVVLGIVGICVMLWLATLEVDSFGERFADLPNAYNNASELLTYPENYTRDDRRLFSGRLFMWSGYITEANQGSELQILIGRGMGSWKGYFEKYAHNTFVSFYFELGLFGLILGALIFLFIYRRLSKMSDSNLRSCAIAFLMGFLVLNMGTMPMWSMEGIYCLAFLIALARTYTSTVRPIGQRVIA